MRPSAPAPVWRAHNSRASASSAMPATSCFRTYRKSLPYAWALMKFTLVLFPTERQQMPAESAHERSRQSVERADEQPVVDRALPTAVEARFHGEALGNNPDFSESPKQSPEFADAELQQHRRVVVLEADLHQLRQPVEPRDAVVDLKDRLAAR